MEFSNSPDNNTFNFEEDLKGEVYSRVSFGVVIDVRPETLKIRNENGIEWTISSNLFEKEMRGTHFEKSEKVSKTELARICNEELSRNDIFKASFTKKDGSERVLRGYKLGSRNYLGHLSVVDLDLKVEQKSHFRTIDLNSLNWIIFGGVKYIRK